MSPSPSPFPSSFSRRQFLGLSLGVGAGALAIDLGGIGAEATASGLRARAAAGIISAPPTPPTMQTFVSRPDITPPGVTVEQSTDVAAIPDQPQYIFLAPKIPKGSLQPIGTQGLMITDLEGRLVWWKGLPAALPFNFRVQTYQGSPSLTWYERSPSGGPAERGVAYVVDSDYNEIASVSTDLYYGVDLHEFLITPTDTALVTAYEFGGATGPVYGHALELPIPCYAGTPTLFDWSSEGNVPTSLSYVPSEDYFHINSVDLWPGEERNVLISSRNTWAVYLIDRETKEIIWRIGGKDSSFTMGPGCAFEFSHDARPLADGTGISLFDDATQPSPEKQSWGKVFDVDTATMEVTLRHEFHHPNVVIDTASQGNNQVLPTGGHFVGWGAVPYFTLFDASGSALVATAILDGRFPEGMGNYRAFMNNWVGTPPDSEMALVVRPGASTGQWVAFMSWNGATEIDSWRINAGTSTHQVDLPTIARKTKNGFETIIAFTLDGATHFQGVALDVNGAVLGRTAIVEVS